MLWDKDGGEGIITIQQWEFLEPLPLQKLQLKWYTSGTVRIQFRQAIREGNLNFDPANPLQHPLTGSARRYVLGDRFHTSTSPHKSKFCGFHDINLCSQHDTIKTSYQECQNNSKNIKRLRSSTMQSFPVHFIYSYLMDFYHNESKIQKQHKQLSSTLQDGPIFKRDKFLRFVVVNITQNLCPI